MEQQQKFTEIFAKDLTDIKGLLNAAIQLETRVKVVEDRESDLERRMSNVEKLLKASESFKYSPLY